MAWTTDQVRQAAASLQPTDPHISYVVDGTLLIGRWDFEAAWSGPTGGGTENRQYRFVVELDESNTSYQTHEEGATVDTGAGIGPDGTGESGFKGHQVSKSFEFSAAPSVEGQDGHTFGYRFDSNTVKQPLMTMLDEAGWKAQHGLIRKIFGG